MARIEQHDAAALLELVAKADPDLLPACRWLVLGRRLAPSILKQEGRVPVFGELVRLLHLVDGEASELEAMARSMVAGNELGAEAEVEARLDQLVAAHASEWAHPAQVLRRPFPELGALLASCLQRLAGRDDRKAGGDARERLESVKENLERAVRIEGNARRRRERGRGAKSMA